MGLIMKISSIKDDWDLGKQRYSTTHCKTKELIIKISLPYFQILESMGTNHLQFRARIGAYNAKLCSPSWSPRSSGGVKIIKRGRTENVSFPLKMLLFLAISTLFPTSSISVRHTKSRDRNCGSEVVVSSVWQGQVAIGCWDMVVVSQAEGQVGACQALYNCSPAHHKAHWRKHKILYNYLATAVLQGGQENFSIGQQGKDRLELNKFRMKQEVFKFPCVCRMDGCYPSRTFSNQLQDCSTCYCVTWCSDMHREEMAEQRKPDTVHTFAISLACCGDVELNPGPGPLTIR